MPFSVDNIDRASLLSIVSTCARLISPKALDITQRAIRLSARENTLVAESTDMAISVKASTECTTMTDGDVMVSGKLLYDLLRTLPGDTVSLKAESPKQVEGKKPVGEQLILKGKGSRAKYRFLTLDVEEFPEFQPMPDDAVSYSVDVPTLALALRQVARFTDNGHLRADLAGVLFELTGEKLRVVGTNTFFFGVRDLEAKLEGDDNGGGVTSKVTAPNHLVAEMIHALSEVKPSAKLSDNASPDSTVSANPSRAVITVSDSQMRVFIDGVEFVSRLLEHPFPAYSGIIPTVFHNQLTVDRAEMLAIVKRLAMMLDELTPVKFSLSTDEVRALSTEKGVGSGDEVFETATWEGEDIVAGYNPKLLYECVEACEGERIVVRNMDDKAPAKITGEGHKEAFFLCIPIRLKGR